MIRFTLVTPESDELNSCPSKPQLMSLSLATTLEDDDVDYEDQTPFLKNDDDASLHRQTPLPIKQISFLLLPWIAESIVDHSISPYLNQVRMTAAIRLCAEPDFSLCESSRSWVEMCGRLGTTPVL